MAEAPSLFCSPDLMESNGAPPFPIQAGKRGDHRHDRSADSHARERNVPDVCNISDIHAVDNAVEYIDKLGEHCQEGQAGAPAVDGIAPEMIDSDRMFSPDFHIGTSFVFSISHENP